MALEELRDLQRSWESSPPLHRLAAAYLGVKPREKPKRATKQDLMELKAMMGG
jgi:hypothetical protein